MNYYLILALFLFIHLSLWFVVSLIKKRNDLADVAWGLGFVLLALTSFYFGYQSVGFSIESGLVTAFVTLWGLRLSGHVYLRNKGREEDYRYKKWRKEWKWFRLRSFFQIYLLQGFLLYIISLPVLAINRNPETFTLINKMGIVIWITGFYFEVIADCQLKKFIEDPQKEGIMQSGLWAWSRHPNYFGEVAQWWGIWILSIGFPGWILALLSPVTITFLILKVSGIPLLEKSMSQKEGFQDYKRRVNKFIPWPPSKNK